MDDKEKRQRLTHYRNILDEFKREWVRTKDSEVLKDIREVEAWINMIDPKFEGAGG